MSEILIHIIHGAEHLSRAALGLLAAKAAIGEGHSVTLFLSEDAVQLLGDGGLKKIAGLGAGVLGEWLDAVVDSGSKIYMLGLHENSHGRRHEEIAGKPIEFSTLSRLVRLANEHDHMLTY